MKITKVHIEKFRGFNDVDFVLGKNITVITGQNGTQKTTLLGILTQTFTISKGKSVLYGETPLCGGDFKSAFSEKFKLSNRFDKAGEHEWKLYFDDREEFTVESMPRGEKDRPGEIRFWQKGKRGKGDGYIQFPVIFLSLKRLYPAGEDKGLKESDTFKLNDDEIEFYKKWHNKILALQDSLTETDFLEGSHKETLGASTVYYDWKQNSAGQDNIGKIILAILSFKRLKEKYPNDYTGGILALDELDATLYPASQLELLKALRRFSSDYDIQIIFTTHSLSLIEKACALQKDDRHNGQIRVVFLRKMNNNVEVVNNVSYPAIKNNLNITLALPDARKIRVFTEDNEARIFAKALLKRGITQHLKFENCNLSCSGLVDLVSRKISPLVFPDSIVMLDGDAKNDRKLMNRIRKQKNIILLPGGVSPERVLAEYLNSLNDEHSIWDHARGFTKQYCFKEISFDEIKSDRVKAKEWFMKHYKDRVWGNGASKLINWWAKDNGEAAKKFVNEFMELYNRFAKELNRELLK